MRPLHASLGRCSVRPHDELARCLHDEPISQHDDVHTLPVPEREVRVESDPVTSGQHVQLVSIGGAPLRPSGA
jgi:hypothetical protein